MNSDMPLHASVEAAPVIPLEYAPPPDKIVAGWRLVAAWGMGLGWICCVVGWFFIVAVDVESVVVTGPILCLLGILSILAGYRLRRVWPILIGICHCAICLAFVAMVAAWDLSPRRAYAPFTLVGGIYTALITAPTYLALFWPKFDLRPFIPGLGEADFVQELSEPLRHLLGYELMHGNVVERIERNRWSRCPLAVVLRKPLKLDSAAREVQLPNSIQRWENRDPRYEPQAGWKCTITLHALAARLPTSEA